MRKNCLILIHLLFLIFSSCEIISDKSYGSKLPEDQFCDSRLCLLDASRLLESGTDDKTVEPCSDFKEFSMGKFIKYRALHDRYDRSGFLFDILVSYRERHRKLLQAPIKKTDKRIYKVAKNFFQKCVDPNYIRTQGKYEAAEYVQNKALPLIDGADWWPDLVNITSHIFDPSWRLEFFTTFKVSRCSNPKDPESEIICFKFSHEFNFLYQIMLKYADKTRLDFINRLKEVDFMIRVDQALVNASINHLFYYVEQKLALDWPGRQAVPIVLKINEINKILLPSSRINLDWLKYINTEFLEHSKAYSDEEEVMIEDWELFRKSMELLENFPVRMITDVFYLGFLYGFEHLYTVYPLSRIDVYKRGTQKDLQRYEQCLQILESNFSPALLSIYAKFYLKKADLEDAEKFIEEAINDVLLEIMNDDELQSYIIDDITRKLKKIIIIPGIYKEILDDSKIDGMYEELELNGDEGMLETTIKLKKHNVKLDNESKRGWYYQANQFSKLSHMKYYPENDLLFIPADYLDYPYYDRNRPRFYNTATLFTEIVLSINEGLKSYLKSEYNLRYTFNYDSIQLGYKNYLKWERNNYGKEMKIPGFTLSNRQMYWLSFANSYYTKYRTNVPFYQLQALELQYKHFHVWLKAREEFREAFQCDEMTEDELQDFEILKENFNNVLRL